MQDTEGLKKIYILLAVGGAIVATTFVVGKIFGIATWTSWWIANVLHFIGGFYAFFFIEAVYQYTRDRHRISAPPLTEIALFIVGALIMGVVWEWFELSLDRYRVFIDGLPSFMTYADNIGDLITDTAGAILAGIIVWKRRQVQPFELNLPVSSTSDREVVA